MDAEEYEHGIKYQGWAVKFETAENGKIFVSTRRHGDLGEMWEEPNGSYSARANGDVARNIGNSAAAFKWIIEKNNQHD